MGEAGSSDMCGAVVEDKIAKFRILRIAQVTQDEMLFKDIDKNIKIDYMSKKIMELEERISDIERILFPGTYMEQQETSSK